jgi:hypothetical protein
MPYHQDDTALIYNHIYENVGPSLHRAIESIVRFRASLKRNPSGQDISVFDILNIPTRMVLESFFAHPSADVVFKSYNKAEFKSDTLLRAYDRLTPSLLRRMYEILKSDGAVVTSLGLHFSQMAHESGVLPGCGDKPSGKLLGLLHEDDLNEFGRVQEKVWQAALFHLNLLVNRVSSVTRLQETYEGARGSAPFLNAIFTKVADPYVMEITAAIEMSGRDLDDPAIIQNVLFQDDYALAI